MTFTIAQKVLFRHCDPAGIVFYPRFFEMINDCVEAFFEEQLTTPFASLHGVACVPTVTIETTFSAPSRLGDTLFINLSPTRIGRSSLGLNFVALCGEEPRFSADSTLVYTNANGRPQSWPDNLRATITAMIKEQP